MSILDTLMRRRTQDKSIVWGIRATRKTMLRWKLLGALMRVPTNRLVLFALQSWLEQNDATLRDDEARNRLADRIADAYLKGNLN